MQPERKGSIVTNGGHVPEGFEEDVSSQLFGGLDIIRDLQAQEVDTRRMGMEEAEKGPALAPLRTIDQAEGCPGCICPGAGKKSRSGSQNSFQIGFPPSSRERSSRPGN